MIKGNTVLAIIPARGGSKGVHRKNIRLLAGKPLIAWTIEEAKKSKYIDRLILSSEDDEIIQIAQKWGCEVPFVRPTELAQDSTPGIEPVLHAMEVLPEKYDYVVLLQVTSPLRTVDDIDGCLEFCIDHNATTCISVAESNTNPYWMYFLGENNILESAIPTNKQYTRRQDLPKAYFLNGAVYVARNSAIKREKSFLNGDTIAFVMPAERSADIDSEKDLLTLEKAMPDIVNGRKNERNN